MLSCCEFYYTYDVSGCWAMVCCCLLLASLATTAGAFDVVSDIYRPGEEQLLAAPDAVRQSHLPARRLAQNYSAAGR